MSHPLFTPEVRMMLHEENDIGLKAFCESIHPISHSPIFDGHRSMVGPAQRIGRGPLHPRGPRRDHQEYGPGTSGTRTTSTQPAASSSVSHCRSAGRNPDFLTLPRQFLMSFSVVREVSNRRKRRRRGRTRSAPPSGGRARRHEALLLELAIGAGRSTPARWSLSARVSCRHTTSALVRVSHGADTVDVDRDDDHGDRP